MLVGLTGSIGSGKSLAARAFSALGAEIIDADELAREAVAPGSPALRQIREKFGSAVVDERGALKRAALAELVFNDDQARKDLERIVHPRVRQLFKARSAALERRRPPPRLIVFVLPLLFEAGYTPRDFDRIIVVTAPRELCIERVMRRDRCSRSAAEQRYDAQLPIEEKEARAHIVVHNSGTPAELCTEIAALYAELAAGDSA